MYIHLFSVGGSTSEVATQGSSIDKEITGDDTDILPFVKDIEKSGLPGTRDTHESHHRTGFDVSENLVEEAKRSTRDGDGVIDAFPGKGLVVGKGSFLFGLGLLFDGPRSLLSRRAALSSAVSLVSLVNMEKPKPPNDGP